MHARSARRAVEDDIPDSKRCNRNCDPLQSMSMHTQNAAMEPAHGLRSPRSRTGIGRHPPNRGIVGTQLIGAINKGIEGTHLLGECPDFSMALCS
ncbi:hypothetical protein VN12_05125 [Pirellula sp. SH-Sr6A]|nr:hypothetical protein VN12_05125 [Pirellula sp. SH-Sr6A]